MKPYAVLFPGQGSQTVGMGGDVFATRPDLLGEAADIALGWSLHEIVMKGPEDELTKTDRAQPALYAIAYALWDDFAAAVGAPPSAAAGHSLGEYTALAAAGAFDFITGLRLVAERGRTMAEAAAAEPSAMAALLGVDVAGAEQIAADRRGTGGRLWVANSNAPGQVVVAGSTADIEWLVEHARDVGARRAIPLKVAGAFHSPFMSSAAGALSEALAAVAFAKPAFPVYANATAMPVVDPGIQLAEQLTAPVRFAECLEHMAAAGIERFVHIGPGDVTAGLARRTVPDAETLVVSTRSDIAAVTTRLSVE